MSSRASECLELIHTDLCGPLPVPSYGGARYYISFTCDKTRYSWVRFLKQKSDTAQAIKDFVTEVELQFATPVKRFRADNGGEYVNNTLNRYFSDRGILLQLTPPYNPESNGVAERLNRSIGEAVRAMILPLNDNQLWAEATNTFIYTKNRLPHSALKDMTPFEALHGVKPTIHHLQPFGRKCFVHIPEAKRSSGSKLSARAVPSIFVGYTDVDHHYRIRTEDKRTFVSADVTFPPVTVTDIRRESRKLHQPSSVLTSIPLNDQGFPTDDMWLAWMDRNPETTLDWWDKGHPKIRNLVQKEFQRGKRDGFLSSTYWNHPNEDNIETPESDPQPPTTHSIRSDHDCQSDISAELQNDRTTPEVERRCPSPLDVSMRDAPPLVPHPPATDRTTRYGRQTRTPREWWKVPPATPQNCPTLVEEEEEELATTEGVSNSILSVDEPTSYANAIASPCSENWKDAMKEELESLHENEVWEVVPKPTHRKIIDGKWVFKVKGNAQGQIERYKARYVARGFSQVQGLDFDEVFAPVARYDSLRLLLAISANRKWRPRQLDIKTAFLYGILKEEVYMQLPEGCRGDGHVALLKRSIYGLKQSPREWYFRLKTFLEPHGFVASDFDPCVWIHESGDLILAVYVDDVTAFGEDSDLMTKAIQLLKSEFKVNDMGDLHWLLGLQIEFTETAITLSQAAYADKILARFGMESCNPVSSPMDVNCHLQARTDDEPKADATSYQQMIGSLMYLVTGTRPDLAYTVTHLSQYNANPSVAHLQAAKRVLRYVKGTRDQKLVYPFGQQLTLSGYCDASYGNCLDTRRSFSGNLYQLGNCTISWRARKQKCVAHSTCESEYMALALASKQHIWLQRGLTQLLGYTVPSAISTDNNGAIDLANNVKLNDASKHIDIAYHFTREKVQNGELNLLHVPSGENLADICTKALPQPTHRHLCTSIFGTK